MKSHEHIDRRGLMLARAIVERIDGDPVHAGLDRARKNCKRWLEEDSGRSAYTEWSGLLSQPWPQVRDVLLDESEKGMRLRQSNPFCGVLTPRERWRIFREFREREKN